MSSGIRTDLALESRELNPDIEGVEEQTEEMERNNYTHEQIETATSYADGDGETERLKAVYRALFDKYKAVCDAEKEKVLETGGLHIIGTERHESRRIDNQLRGRSGRQGDPGSSVFFLSTEDDLARVFGGERMQAVMQFFKLEEDVPIEAKIITRQKNNRSSVKCEVTPKS